MHHLVEVSAGRGLVTYYGLIVMELSSRRICIAGATPHPEHAYMIQVVRNLVDCCDGFLLGKQFLILDQDKFSLEAPDGEFDPETVGFRHLTHSGRTTYVSFEFLDRTGFEVRRNDREALRLDQRLRGDRRRDHSASGYSPLDQVNSQNVQKLRLA